MKYFMQHWHLHQPRRFNDDYWNIKINNECYKPNAKKGNFNHVSFDISPSLAEWLRHNDKKTLDLIIKSDKGQALMHPYTHRILPLIKNKEDLKLQIIWGKKYFKFLFNREPEGIWLPECATNKKVCETLIEENLKFTLGAPWQGNIKNTNKPYKVKIKDKEITYFFYHHFSSEVSFEDWPTQNADNFVKHLTELIKNNEHLLLAYDGELIGHHKNAVKWAFYLPEALYKKNIKFLFLNKFFKKAKEYAEIIDNTSWSCNCGILRWSIGCDCSGKTENSYQKPMLDAFEFLEDKIHEIYFERANKEFFDSLKARKDYIDVKITKTLTKKEFLEKHSKNGKDLFNLLDAEYHVQEMFTSCGWFFSNLGIEAEYNMQDAILACLFIKKETNIDLTKDLLEKLKKAYNWETKISGKEIGEKILKSLV